MSAWASPITNNPDATWTTTDPPTKFDPLSAPGAAVTRDREGTITNVDLDGADAEVDRQNRAAAQSGFDDAAQWAAGWQD
jgi:polygalacturonase